MGDEVVAGARVDEHAGGKVAPSLLFDFFVFFFPILFFVSSHDIPCLMVLPLPPFLTLPSPFLTSLLLLFWSSLLSLFSAALTLVVSPSLFLIFSAPFALIFSASSFLPAFRAFVSWPFLIFSMFWELDRFFFSFLPPSGMVSDGSLLPVPSPRRFRTRNGDPFSTLEESLVASIALVGVKPPSKSKQNRETLLKSFNQSFQSHADTLLGCMPVTLYKRQVFRRIMQGIPSLLPYCWKTRHQFCRSCLHLVNEVVAHWSATLGEGFGGWSWSGRQDL